jgi:hypothetical protein
MSGDHIVDTQPDAAPDGQLQVAQAGVAKPFVSDHAIESFKTAIASGADIGVAVDAFVAAEIAQAVARGVPKAQAESAAKLFVGELSGNLNAGTSLVVAIADAERVFTGALRNFLSPTQDPVLAALSSGSGLDQALAQTGAGGRGGDHSLGEALHGGERTGDALGKAKTAIGASDKAGEGGDPLLDALVSGGGIDGAFGAMATNPLFAERFVEALRAGLDPAAALESARAAVNLANQALAAADAANKGGALGALASGQNLAQAIAQQDGALNQLLASAGVVQQARPGAGGADSTLALLASGAGIGQALPGSGAAFDQALSNALASGLPLVQAIEQAKSAQTLADSIGSNALMESLATGSGNLGGSGSNFDKALGEALNGGQNPVEAVATATERATTIAKAEAKASAPAPDPQPVPVPPPPPQAVTQPLPPPPVVQVVPPPVSVPTSPVAFVTPPAPVTSSSTNTTSPPPPQQQTQTATVTDTSRNDPASTATNTPVRLSIDPTATLAEDGTLVITFQASDPDGTGVTVTATSDNDTLFGTGAIALGQGGGGRTLTLAPSLNQNGTATITVTASGIDGTTASGTVDVTVTPVNDAPTGADKSLVFDEDTSRVIALSDFGYSDVEDDAMSSVRLLQQSGGGTLQHRVGGVWSAVDLGTGAQDYTKADVEAGNLRFVPVADANGLNYSAFTFKLSDGALFSTVSKTLTMNVTAVNDAPVGGTSSVTLVEDDTRLFRISDFVFTDVDGDEMGSVQFVSAAGAGTLQHLASGSWSTVDLSGGPQTFTAADIEDGNLRYVPVADGNGDGYASFAVKVGDGTVFSASSATVTVNVTPVNDAPTATDQTLAATEDTARVLTAADFGFADIDGDSLGRVTLLTMTGQGAIEHRVAGTWSSLTLDGSGVTITRADLNDENLRFMPAAHGNGNGYASVTVRVGDASLDATATNTLTFDVAAVNDAPTVSHHSVTLVRGQSISLASKLVATDIEQGADSLVYTVTSLPADGAIYLNDVKVGLNGTFTQDQINNGEVLYQHYGWLGVGNDSFVFSVSDGAGAVVTGQTFSATVNSSTAPQNIHTYTHASFSGRTTATYVDDRVPDFTTNSSGSFTLNGVSGPVTSATLVITAKDVDRSAGEWDYVSINNHQLGLLDGENNETSQTSFTVDPDFLKKDGTDNVIGVRVTTNGTTEGGWTVILDKATMTIGVTNMVGATVSAFDLTGATVSGGTASVDAHVALSIVNSGTYRVTFKTVDKNGSVVASESVDVSGLAGQTVQVDASPSYAISAASGTFEQQVTLTLVSGGAAGDADRQTIKYKAFSHTQDVGPSINHSISTLAENVGVGTVVALLGHSDADIDQGVDYTLVNNAGGLFSLVTTNGVTELRTAGALNYEVNASHSYTVTVKATDATGLSFFEDLTVTTSNVNEQPYSFGLSHATVSEHAVAGARVATLSTADPDIYSGNTFTYTMTGGATDVFEVIGSSLYLKAGVTLDYETTQSYSVSLRTTDQNGLFFDGSVNISVADLPETPAANMALSLDGSDDYARASGISLNGGQSFTWEFWAYRSDDTTNDFVLGQGTTTLDDGFHAGFRGGTVNGSNINNVFVFGFWGDDDLNYTDTDSSLNEWNHWAGSYDAQTRTRTLYKNGVEVAHDTADGDYTGSGDLFIGAFADVSSHYSGFLDEVRVWSDVRSATEIRNSFAREVADNEANLVASWHFNDGSGVVAQDQTVGDHDATITGGASWADLINLDASNNTTASTHILGTADQNSGALAFTVIGKNGGTGLGTGAIDYTTGVVTYSSGSNDGTDHMSYQISDNGSHTTANVVSITVT